MGQTSDEPEHVSATSQPPIDAARQTVPIGLKASMGHAAAFPGQCSATSQPFAVAARQTVAVDRNASLGQVAELPRHVSATSQTPAEARQTVPIALKPSLGQVFAVPLQFSATSQTPFCARQTVMEFATPSAGQVVADPLQVSATSQTPFCARQTVPSANVVHVPLAEAPAATLQAWQSPVTVPPHAELQQTPSTQLPDKQSLPVTQATPRSNLHALVPVHEPMAHSLSGSAPVTIGPHVPFVPWP